MDSQIIRFYQVLKDHQFTEAEVEDMMEGIRALLKDEGRENATKKDIGKLQEATKKDISELREVTRKDISELREEVRKDTEELKREIAQVQLSLTQTFHQSEEKQSDRFRYVYEKIADNHKSTISWMVGTSIAIVSLLIAAMKLI